MTDNNEEMTFFLFLLIADENTWQLICYALMKILLKDVIDSDDDCKGLLVETNSFFNNSLDK
jgi:hypothetical protein